MSVKYTQGAFDTKWRCTKRETERAQGERETEGGRGTLTRVSSLSAHLSHSSLVCSVLLYLIQLYINLTWDTGYCVGFAFRDSRFAAWRLAALVDARKFEGGAPRGTTAAAARRWRSQT